MSPQETVEEEEGLDESARTSSSKPALPECDEAELIQMQMALQTREDRELKPHRLNSNALRHHDSQYRRARSAPGTPAPTAAARSTAPAAPVKKRKCPEAVAASPSLSAPRSRLAKRPAANLGTLDSQSQGDAVQASQSVQQVDTLEDSQEVDAAEEVDPVWMATLQAGWEGCVAADSLNFDDPKNFTPLKAPKGVRPAVDAKKWDSAVQLLGSHLLVFHGLLVANTRPNDQTLKSTATWLKKNDKNKAKKAGLKDENSFLMVDKIKALGELISSLKNFRSEVLSQKPPVKPEQLQARMDALEKLWGQVLVEKKIITPTWVAVPDIWVTSWVSHILSRSIRRARVLRTLLVRHSILYCILESCT